MITNINLPLAEYGKISVALRNWHSKLIKNVFEFDGYLVVYLHEEDYSKDTIIKTKMNWIDYISFDSNRSNTYEYDRYINIWNIANISIFSNNYGDKNQIDSIIYNTSKGFYRYDYQSTYNYNSELFIDDYRYFLNTNSFIDEPVFYSSSKSDYFVKIFKGKFKAIIVEYELKDKTVQVLMPVSEALEFRPGTESEASSMGYEKADVVVILK